MKKYTMLETFGEELQKFLFYMQKIESYILPETDYSDGIKCLADVRKKIDLIIVDRQALVQNINETRNEYVNKGQLIQSKIDQSIQNSRQNDTPRDTDYINNLKYQIHSIEGQKRHFEDEANIPDLENNYLGIYTRCYPLLGITKPTIVLFKDAIEGTSKAISIPNITTPDCYLMVYIHELFHAFYDSPDYNKLPDPKLEETMAQFGTHVLINDLFGDKSRLLELVMVHSGLCADAEKPYEYFYGLLLFENTENSERWNFVMKYRSLSRFIDTSMKYSDFDRLYREYTGYSKSTTNYIRQILFNGYPWETWFYNNQLPRFCKQ